VPTAGIGTDEVPMLTKYWQAINEQLMTAMNDSKTSCTRAATKA
jgi:hypothetical protein